MQLFLTSNCGNIGIQYKRRIYYHAFFMFESTRGKIEKTEEYGNYAVAERYVVPRHEA